MRRHLLCLTLSLIGTGVNGVCMSEPSEHMVIEKQIRLSAGHQVMPYSIARVSNGDLIVFGSNGQSDNRAWATRLTQNGAVRWEILQGGSDGWDDRSEMGQRFYSTLELPDKTTLLCGIGVNNYKRSILLEHVAFDGNIISEHLIRPDRVGSSIAGFECIWWNDGIILIGSVSGSPKGTGWLAKLDSQLNIEWQKFSDQFVATQVMPATDGELFIINPFLTGSNSSQTSIVKLSEKGEVLAHHEIPDNEGPVFVHPMVPQPDVRVALTKSTLSTEIISLDDQLRGPTHVIELQNAGVKKCLELSDGSLAIFGSQFHNTASAAVTRVYTNGSFKGFLAQPLNQSPWYYDAVLTGKTKEFAATKSVGVLEAVLDWISFD